MSDNNNNNNNRIIKKSKPDDSLPEPNDPLSHPDFPDGLECGFCRFDIVPKDWKKGDRDDNCRQLFTCCGPLCRDETGKGKNHYHCRMCTCDFWDFQKHDKFTYPLDLGFCNSCVQFLFRQNNSVVQACLEYVKPDLKKYIKKYIVEYWYSDRNISRECKEKEEEEARDKFYRLNKVLKKTKELLKKELDNNNTQDLETVKKKLEDCKLEMKQLKTERDKVINKSVIHPSRLLKL